MTELVHMDAYARASLPEREAYLATLARAGDLLPRAYQGRPMPNPNGPGVIQNVEVGKLMLVAELGSSLGLHPTSAIQSIFIIDGKPSLSANLLSALVRKAGHKLRVSTRGSIPGNDFVAVAELIRADDPDFTFHVEWTMERAQRAGLLGKDNWKKYPEAMLKSRALTEIVREGAPDVTFFAAYVPEELGANVNEEGDPVELTEVKSPAAPAPAAPAAQPKPDAPVKETPVVEEPKAEEPTEDWGKRISLLTGSAETRALYLEVQEAGLLDMDIKQGRKKRKLGEVIVEVGTAFINAEKEAADASRSSSGPAVLDPSLDEPVDAEVVD